MSKKFTELRADMRHAAREKSDGMARQILAEMLHVRQPSIAMLDKRTDMNLSTLRSHIEAMSGELEVIARYPDGAVKISSIAELGDAASL